MNPKPFPINEFPTLPELCKEIFRHFSEKNLWLNSIGRGPPGSLLDELITKGKRTEMKYEALNHAEQGG